MKKIVQICICVLLTGCYSAFGQINNTESFDNLFRPSGWSGGISSGNYDWKQYSPGAHTGTDCAIFDSYNASAGSAATLISPVFSLACRSGAITTSFWMWRESSNPGNVDYMQVYINTAASLAGATLLTSTGGNNQIDRPIGSAPIVGANGWYQYTYNIPVGFNTASNYIIFNAVSAYGTSMYIDDAAWTSYPCSAGPANDLCTGAITATCGNTYTGSTATATTSGDPTSYCGTTPAAPGVFYVFAGNGQNITASLCGSAYDTKIDVYSGSCGTYTCVGGNDDFCSVQSSVTFSSSVGTNYYILINGFGGATGAYSLALTCAAPPLSNDNCSSPISIPVTVNCAAPTAGTSSGGTTDITGCIGNADDDVWYSFVATGTSHQITVVPSAGYDAVVELFSGPCSSLISQGCQDAGGTGVTEVLNATGLTIGTTYEFRVYHFGVGSGTNTFTICITLPPAAPANDNCAGATSITVNTTCITTAGTTANATSSATGCSGTASQDVWYTFTAVNSSAVVTVTPSSTMDAVFELYSGSCAALTEIQCEDVNATAGVESYAVSGLIVGNSYFVRVYDYLGTSQTFTICVYGPAAAVIPSNDDPCNAIALPAVTPACNYEQFTTLNSTQTSLALAPTPSACTGGSGGSAGYSLASAPGDVWFSVVCPASGQMTITSEPYGQIYNVGTAPHQGIEDGSMALYSGPCSALVQIACSSDNAGYPNGSASSAGGSANNYNQELPYINVTGLTAGATYFIRYWPFNGADSGPFGLCVQTTTNDACANALYICDLNGFGASTSNAYTADRPGSGATEMAGDAELCCWSYHSGTNELGVFGQVDANGDVNTSSGGAGTEEGVGRFDVAIDNNSWISFTAASTKVVLTVTVGICFKNEAYPLGGIQMQVFSNTACTDFVPVSAFLESTTSFVMTMTNLTPGAIYMLMVDGFAADVCNYTISANNGVSFGAIVAGSPVMCVGDNDNLTAPAGATSYVWPQTGDSVAAITVQPATTTTYTCIVTGNCGVKQTLLSTVTVSSACAPLPVELLNFKAFYDGEAAKLIWETSSETNNSYFTVERSEDGNDYGPIGVVNTKAPGGNSNSPLHYLLRDPNIKSGTYYYRVKQTDVNGNSRYSEPVSLQISGGKSLFAIQPNPTEGLSNLTYYCDQAEQDVLKVYDDTGHLIFSKEVSSLTGMNSVPVDLGNTPTGIYHVTMNVNHRLFGVRLIKAKL